MSDPTPPEAALSADHVRKVAKLARLALPEDRVEPYRLQLAAVLGYVDRLRELKLDSVEPMAHAGDTVNRLDADVPGPVLPNAVLMAIAPAKTPPFIRVPKVIDDGTSA